jgi:hypothetical protein
MYIREYVVVPSETFYSSHMPVPETLFSDRDAVMLGTSIVEAYTEISLLDRFARVSEFEARKSMQIYDVIGEEHVDENYASFVREFQDEEERITSLSWRSSARHNREERNQAVEALSMQLLKKFAGREIEILPLTEVADVADGAPVPPLLRAIIIPNRTDAIGLGILSFTEVTAPGHALDGMTSIMVVTPASVPQFKLAVQPEISLI